MKQTETVTTSKKKDSIPVWIIDDNKSFCILLSVALNASKTVQCERFFLSSKTALRELKKTSFPPPVILLDIKMPVLSGLDSIPFIKNLSPNTLIIMLTSFDGEKEIKTALDRGACGYLLKTSTPQDVVRAVEMAKKGGSPLDPMITKKILSALLSTNPNNRQSSDLSEREMDVINLIVKGLSTKKISEKLFISYYTADTHLKNIYQKLNIHNRQTLVRKAFEDHLVR